jgi:hypothetical protein
VNNDQIKVLLLKLADAPEDFSVVLTGKKSRKVHGLYRPETREILIHNRNHKTDNDLLHTAIHEYAHHLQYCEAATPISGRVHTSRFWAIFHELLYKAESMRLYSNPFDGVADLRRITDRIHALTAQNGTVVKELGDLLRRARELCARHNADFGDYLDRALRLPRSFAGAAERVASMDLDPRIGFENMKALSRIPEPAARAAAAQGLLASESPDMVRDRYAAPARGGAAAGPPDPAALLRTEKRRIERTIAHLESRLAEVESRLERLGAGGGGGGATGSRGGRGSRGPGARAGTARLLAR